jgi:hypothetical protein
MSTSRMNEVFTSLADLSPVQRWAVGQVLRAFGDEPLYPRRLPPVNQRKKHELALAFVEQCCVFDDVTTTDAELFAAYQEWCKDKQPAVRVTQNGLAESIASSYPDRVRRRRLQRTHNSPRPRVVTGIRLSDPKAA